MKPFVMQTRQQAYVEILRWGLLGIREAAWAGKLRICEIEADHIHNLPSLLDEPNEARHHCYIGQERAHYVAQLKELTGTEPDYVAARMRFYTKPWHVLSSLAQDEVKHEEGRETKAG